MQKPSLTDSTIYPDPPILARHLGATNKVWEKFLLLLKTNFPHLSLQWRFYRDGGSWLGKLTGKTKTVCWVSIWEGYFKCSFFFTSKADSLIRDSSLDPGIIDQYYNAASVGKLKPVIIEVRKGNDLKTVEQLILLRLRLK